MKISYQKSCLLDEQHLLTLLEQLSPEIERVSGARALHYDTPYASINLPFDEAMVERVRHAVREKKDLNPAVLVVIGIGGSNLGTKAVHEALCGLLHNEQDALKLYYADTVDTDYIAAIMRSVQAHLQAGQTVILNGISKSGSTIETVANFQCFIQLLAQYVPDYHRYVVITTDRDSVLFKQARSDFTCLEIPAQVGGRYSVFSSVGLFPLALMGVDIDALLRGARDMVKKSTEISVHNYAAVRAIILAELYRARIISIHDYFIFAVNLAGVGAWYRQLMGESIGKAFDRRGNKVEVGIVPTVSIGSIDLHSVAQLYLGGPRNMVTTFLTVQKPTEKIQLAHDQFGAALAPALEGKTFAQIMQAIVDGVRTAYQADARPYVSIELERVDAYAIGSLLQMHMIEMMYLGFLLEVNPFDQPQVELYKKETGKILSHG